MEVHGLGMPKRYPDIEPIPDPPENVAKAIMRGAPKDEWQFEKERHANPAAESDEDD